MQKPSIKQPQNKQSIKDFVKGKNKFISLTINGITLPDMCIVKEALQTENNNTLFENTLVDIHVELPPSEHGIPQ